MSRNCWQFTIGERMHKLRASAWLAMMLLCCSWMQAAELKPKTVDAFNHYVKLTEARVSAEQAGKGPFFLIDAMAPQERQRAIDSMKNGEVFIDSRKTRDGGKEIDVPSGMIHHWLGMVFIPGGTIKDVLALAQDYNNHNHAYSPDVERSKLISRKGDTFQIYYRLRRKKVITAVLDTYYDIHYGPIVGKRTTSRSYSTKIQEIADPGEPTESAKPVDDGTGFLWRLNTYWSWEERDGGLYMQLEAVSLSRDIPTGLEWVVGRFVKSVPRESLMFTLGRTRDLVLARVKK